MAKPRHDGCGPHTFVAAMHFGFAPPQSASETQATHVDVKAVSLHFGVVPEQAVQFSPQLSSLLQTEHSPAPSHSWFFAQSAWVGA
jgi:hypothetical protein